VKRFCLPVVIFAVLVLSAGCTKQQTNEDAIRAGINEHLNSLQTLNLGAMDMTVTSVSIQGNQAQAQVEFRPKTGSPSGAGMQVAYSLQKQDGKWIVQNSQPIGGMMSHPGPGQNPADGSAPSSPNALPNFNDLVGSPEGSTQPGAKP
jgi:hypothetical protein